MDHVLTVRDGLSFTLLIIAALYLCQGLRNTLNLIGGLGFGLAALAVAYGLF